MSNIGPIDPKQLAFVRIPVKCIDTVVAALQAAGHDIEAANVKGFSLQYTDPEANAVRLKWLGRADGRARDGEVEHDSDSAISESDNGAYVMGWVWVQDVKKEDVKKEDVEKEDVVRQAG